MASPKKPDPVMAAQEAEYARLVKRLLETAKLRPDQRDPLRFDLVTALLPLIGRISKEAFQTVGAELESALVAALLQATGAPLQRSLVGCLIKMYITGRSYSSRDSFVALEETLTKSGGNTKEATKVGILEAMGSLVNALGRMLPCASAAGPVLKQLKSDSPMIRCAAIRTLAALVRTAGPDIPRSDVLKPVGKAVLDGSADVRVACGEAVEALAVSQADGGLLTVGGVEGLKDLCFKGLDDADDGVRHSFGSALAGVLLIAIQQQESLPKDAKKKSDSIFSSKKNDPAVLTVSQAVGVCCECFVRPMSTRNLRSGLMQTIQALLLKLSAADKLAKVSSAVAQQVLTILESSKAYESAEAYLHARTCACEVISVGLVSHLDEPSQRALTAALCGFLSTGSHTEMYACAIFGQLTKLCTVLGATMTSIQGDVIAQCMASVSSEHTAVRLAASTSLGALATALPEQRYALLQYCVNVVNTHKETGIGSRVELCSLHGHVHAASALIASAANSKLGIPFHVTDDILETATALLTLNEAKAYEAGQVVAAAYWEAGWVLVGSMMQLGATWTSPRLTKLLALWKMALTRKPATKQDGKSITAEFRARMFALSALCTFTKSCTSLLNDQLVKVVLLFLWQTIEPIRSMPDQIKGLEQVRMAMSLLKAKVYTALLQLPSSSTGNRLAVLAQMTVSDICDGANGKLHIAAVLSRKDSTLSAPLEGSNGAMASYGHENLPQWGSVTPLDIWGDISSQVYGECSLVGQRLLESSSKLFSHLFAAQTAQNQTRVLEHLAPVIKQSQQQLKAGRVTRHPVVVLTVCAALLSLLKSLVQSKQRMQPSVSLNSLLEVSCILVSDPVAEVRRAGSEMLGCLAWLSQGATTNAVLPHALQNLQSTSAHVKAGWALALGCVSSFQPTIGSPRKNDTLNVTVSSIQHLASDSSPEVAWWAMHSLWRTIESTGIGFSPLTESTLVKLYSVCTGDHAVTLGMLSALAKITRSLVGSMGPELAPGADITNKCHSLARHVHACTVPTMLASLLPQSYGGAHLTDISLEAVRTLCNQLVFSPHLIVARDELPFLLQAIQHEHMSVREEATQCIFHIVSRDPAVLHKDFSLIDGSDHSLEAMLFDMLSVHGNEPISNVIEETIQFILKETCLQQPSRIMYQCRRIITGATDRPKARQDIPEPVYDDDGNEVVPEGEQEEAPKKEQPVRWQAKQFATACLIQLIELIEKNGDTHHFCPIEARTVGEGLVLILPQISTIAFTCALSEVESLRPAGLTMFTKVLQLFGATENPDAEGILLVEDFVAQISAAVREAFSPDALPGVTAAACKLCTLFMQNVVCYSDKNLMKRIKGFMSMPLDSLPTLRYNAYYESESSRVQVAFLEAHAKLYLVADKPEVSEVSRQLGDKLLSYWLDFLRDCASLALLSFQDLKKMAAASGCFFTQGSAHQVGPIFGAAEGIVLHAAIAALAQCSEAEESTTVDAADSLHLLLGLCVRNLLAASAPAMLACPKSGVRRVSLALALSLPPVQSVTERLQDALDALSSLFAIKVVVSTLQQSIWCELFKVLEVVASAAFTERSPEIVNSVAVFIQKLLQQVKETSTKEGNLVVQLAVEFIQTSTDFPASCAMSVYYEAFAAAPASCCISFAKAAASKSLEMLSNRDCDDMCTRYSIAVLKSVALLSQDDALEATSKEYAADVLHAAVASTVGLLQPNETTGAALPLALMALLSQVDLAHKMYLPLYEAGAAVLERVAVSDHVVEDGRHKAVMVLKGLSQPVVQFKASDDEFAKERVAAAKCMLRCGMTAAIALVGCGTAPEKVRCESLQLLLFGLQAADDEHKTHMMAFVAPLVVHMLKDSNAAAAVQAGVNAITVLAPQPEFKVQLAALPASMKADLQQALKAGAAQTNASKAKGKAVKPKMKLGSFRK